MSKKKKLLIVVASLVAAFILIGAIGSMGKKEAVAEAPATAEAVSDDVAVKSDAKASAQADALSSLKASQDAAKASAKASKSAAAAKTQAESDAKLAEFDGAVYAEWLKQWGVSSPTEILIAKPDSLAGYVSEHTAESDDRIAFTVQTDASKEELKQFARSTFSLVGKEFPQLKTFVVRDKGGDLAQVYRGDVPYLTLAN